jgi:hypothetical protein
MATITKKADRGIQPAKRYQYWKSSENADDATIIAAGDVFRIEDSLGKPASYFYIETGAATVLSIRLNSRVVTYPLRDARLNWPVPSLDLENPIERLDDSMGAIEIGADEVWEFQGVMPVSDIEIVVFSAGSFEIFVS